MSFNSIEYHSNLENTYQLVPFSKASEITRENNKIILTFQQAIEYLSAAFKNPDIEKDYGKYFAFAEYKERMRHYEKNNPQVSENDLEIYKNQLIEEICNRLSERVDDNLIISTLEKIIELSAKGLALDKKTGTLYLISRNQRNQNYSLTQINATNSEYPSLSDWKRVNSNLLLTDRENRGYICVEELVHNGSKFSIAHTIPNSSDITLKFVWENKKEEIEELYAQQVQLNEENLDRKYLHIKTSNDELYIKSHTNETPALISDDIYMMRGLHEFLNENIPSNGCCFIQNAVLEELFAPRTPQIKSANSQISNSEFA